MTCNHNRLYLNAYDLMCVDGAPPALLLWCFIARVQLVRLRRSQLLCGPDGFTLMVELTMLPALCDRLWPPTLRFRGNFRERFIDY